MQRHVQEHSHGRGRASRPVHRTSVCTLSCTCPVTPHHALSRPTRDIKPENILAQTLPDGSVQLKLSDLRYAHFDMGHNLSSECGTPEFQVYVCLGTLHVQFNQLQPSSSSPMAYHHPVSPRPLRLRLTFHVYAVEAGFTPGAATSGAWVRLHCWLACMLNPGLLAYCQPSLAWCAVTICWLAANSSGTTRVEMCC